MTLKEAVATGLPFSRDGMAWFTSRPTPGGETYISLKNAIADDWIVEGDQVKKKRKVTVWRWEKIKDSRAIYDLQVMQTSNLLNFSPGDNWTKVPGSEREIEVEE